MNTIPASGFYTYSKPVSLPIPIAHHQTSDITHQALTEDKIQFGATSLKTRLGLALAAAAMLLPLTGCEGKETRDATINGKPVSITLHSSDKNMISDATWELCIKELKENPPGQPADSATCYLSLDGFSQWQIKAEWGTPQPSGT